MKLNLPKERHALTAKEHKKYQSLTNLIVALNEKDLTEEFISQGNAEIAALDKIDDSNPSLSKAIKKTQTKIYNRAVSKLKYVSKGYYTALWMSLGMTMFGIPFGTVFGIVLDSMAFLSVGLPIGLGIGLAIGASMDKKAESEGRVI
ncbi:hypothetical protein [Ekhidna sp.]|uniref:hypothetical protein n=1 Tax=Ekhidna sp. TaxID=2608089 RepID=UPI003BAAFB5E